MIAERRTEIWLFCISAAVLAATWVAALSERISGAEEWFFRLFNDLPDWLELPTWPLMQLGMVAAVPVVALAAWWFVRDWKLPAAVVVAGGVAWALAKVVKALVERGRPQDYLPDVNLRPEWEGLGFVSGHAAVAFALATVVSPLLSRPWKIVVWAAAIATALLRMYTAAHLPLDIVGGAGLGIALGAAARFALPRPETATGPSG